MRRSSSARNLWGLALAVIVAGAWQATAQAVGYRSPIDVVASPDGVKLYVSDKTAACVVVVDAASGQVDGIREAQCDFWDGLGG